MLFESNNLRVEADDQIATLWLDAAGRRENAIGRDFIAELAQAIQIINDTGCLDVLVVRSANPGHFACGSVLQELARFTDAEDFTAFAGRGQRVLEQIESLNQHLPTIALIEGTCTGAGLELALACGRRIAVNSPLVEFGLPQVEQGLLPFMGGTVRLPRLIGLDRALAVILEGETLGAVEAARCGLVERLLDASRARTDLQTLLDQLQDGKLRGRRRRLRIAEWMPFHQSRTLRQAERWLLADTPTHEAPAKQEALRAIAIGLTSSEEGYARERAAFSMLGSSDAFHQIAQLHRSAEEPARIYPEPVNPISPLPTRVAVVGGGKHGTEIAGCLSLHGREVVLREASETALDAANRRLDTFFGALVRRGRIASGDAERMNRGILRTTAWNGIENAGWVVEAVDEDLGVKREVFHELEMEVRPRTLLTSTSSTLRIEAIQAELLRPGRVAGVHFPVDPNESHIAEIVRSPLTDSDTLAALDAWLRQLGATPMIASDRPGRIVQRLRLAMFSEAVLLVAEGVPAEQVDRQARRFGIAPGPLEAIDAMGFDKLAQHTSDLQLARGDHANRVLLLERMRSLGWDGKKNGEGFYCYRGRKRWPNKLARVVMWQDLDEDVISHYVFDPEETLRVGLERIVLRTINEAAACLNEEPDADPATIDLAAAWGFGWAPFRGGPLRYADQQGLASVAERLTEFAEQFGPRFEPCLELQRRAEACEPFHGGAVTEEVLRLPESRRLAG